MSQIKICPDCKTEYFAHIELCADCGTALLLPEENRMAQEERERTRASALENAVVAREGALDWINELYNVLIDSGITCTVSADDGCSKGCCGNTCRLMVSSNDAERATERIEEYYMEIHPEIRASREMMSQGKCPACGSPVNSNAVECPDCGLTLLITE